LRQAAHLVAGAVEGGRNIDRLRAHVVGFGDGDDELVSLQGQPRQVGNRGDIAGRPTDHRLEADGTDPAQAPPHSAEILLRHVRHQLADTRPDHSVERTAEIGGGGGAGVEDAAPFRLGDIDHGGDGGVENATQEIGGLRKCVVNRRRSAW
jgi:hypothetical protein